MRRQSRRTEKRGQHVKKESELNSVYHHRERNLRTRFLEHNNFGEMVKIGIKMVSVRNVWMISRGVVGKDYLSIGLRNCQSRRLWDKPLKLPS